LFLRHFRVNEILEQIAEKILWPKKERIIAFSFFVGNVDVTLIWSNTKKIFTNAKNNYGGTKIRKKPPKTKL
jgi:hypothetical protein